MTLVECQTEILKRQADKGTGEYVGVQFNPPQKIKWLFVRKSGRASTDLRTERAWHRSSSCYPVLLLSLGGECSPRIKPGDSKPSLLINLLYA